MARDERRHHATVTLFETKMPADDLTTVDYEDERQFVLLDSAPADERENDRVPKDDGRQRQRIVARHVAALAEHQLHLTQLDELIAGRNG